MKFGTQTEFAEAIGLSQQRYNHYTLGKREPDITLWRLIRSKLEVSVDFIMFGDGISSRPPGAEHRSSKLTVVPREKGKGA